MLFTHLRRRALATFGVLSIGAASLATGPASASSGFGDVTTTDFYAAPVQWLVDEGLTDGTSPGCYSPAATVSRAQFATFLYRYAGEPAVGSHSFVDVPSGSYYDDAVAWMVAEGITNGTSPTTFSPGAPITRAALAAFLHRYAGSPWAPQSGFSDVPRNTYYAVPVDWMVAQGITNGTSATTFSPNRTLNRAEMATFLYRFAGSPSVDVEPGGYCIADQQVDFSGPALYENDFSTSADGGRIDQFVAYRDPFVVRHTTGTSDHARGSGINCSGPDTTRTQTIGAVADHVYQCLPGGNADLGHQMAYAMDSSGYGFVGALPDQVFRGVRQVAVDVNTTQAGSRNFLEIKVLPADQTFVNAMPCGPDLPCNDGWDYDDIGGVGASTDRHEGTGLKIHTPAFPDGLRGWAAEANKTGNGDTIYGTCPQTTGWCGATTLHEDNLDIRNRYRHVFRDNGNGTLSFGVEEADGSMHWLVVPGSFPDGDVRVVIAFHNYTGTKDGNGPGFHGNISPSTGGFTWHWDDLAVHADSSVPSAAYYGGTNADHIVTPDNCVAFALGQRNNSHHTDIAPRIVCEGTELPLG